MPNIRCSSPRDKIDIITVVWTAMTVVQELRRLRAARDKEIQP